MQNKYALPIFILSLLCLGAAPAPLQTPPSDSTLMAPATTTPKKLCCYNYISLTEFFTKSQSSLDTYNSNWIQCPASSGFTPNPSNLNSLMEYGLDEGNKPARKIYSFSCQTPSQACMFVNSNVTSAQVIVSQTSKFYTDSVLQGSSTNSNRITVNCP